MAGTSTLQEGTAKVGLVLPPKKRRRTILEIIDSAHETLILTLFQCDDFAVLDALAAAVRRNVKVEVLVTRRARDWKKRLDELSGLLRSIGAEVYRYGPNVKYHAKYIVADEASAVIGSFNLTRRCFTRTSDFLLVTHDADVISGLKTLFYRDVFTPGEPLPAITDQLIVGPEQTRARLRGLLASARESICIIDRRLTDPEMRRLLQEKMDSGVTVQVLGDPIVGGFKSHGAMFLVDGRIAVTGSVALTTKSLDVRRELALVTSDPAVVTKLKDFFAP